MKLQIIEQDFASGLALVRDNEDPPRYYLKQRHRLELIAIGNGQAARSRFAIRRKGALPHRMPPPGTGPVPTAAGAGAARPAAQ